jgi:hypothetical protein
MDGNWWTVLLVLAALAVAALALVWRPVRSSLRQSRLARARQDFHRHRERLEARFWQLAGSCGKPRGLEWVSCDFDDDVVYARDRRSGELAAFVAVTIKFEAIAGGPMEDVEAVGNLRAATAVFRCQRGRWMTEGRAIFNLNPTEAVRHFHEMELVGHEVARS